MPRHDTAVVHFVRSLNARIAGGARAVLERAGMFARTGWSSHLVVTGVVNEHEIAQAREAGLLDPALHVHSYVREAPSWQDLQEAGRRAPLAPAAVMTPGTSLVRQVETDGFRRTVETTVDGVVRRQEVTSVNARRTRRVSLFDDRGRRTESWLYVDGLPVVASTIDPGTGRWVRSDYIAEGRYRWATVEYDPPLGTAPATLHTTGEQTDVGTVLARWLDRKFAAWDQVVVFADGENVWQRGLRRMRHPGVRGVSVLHNSHLAAPYDASADTKPHWGGFFDDLTNVHTMVCLTGRQREDLVERYGDLSLEIVHHAVPAPRELPKVTRGRHLVFIGRLAEQKRIEHLLQAFATALTEVPDARLVIYGSGPEEDHVRRWIFELGLDGAVEMRGHTTDPLGAFAEARAAVMTSRYEGLPLTLTEGMAVGTPFIAYDLNYGPAEVIRDGVDGYLVPTGDVEAFAERIVAVLRDDALARRLSEAAREVVDRFSTDRYQRSWTRVLHAVADEATIDRDLVKEDA